MGANSPNNGNEEGWSAILGLPIPVRRLKRHFWSFSASVTILTAINIAARIATGEGLQWHKIPPMLTADIVPTVIFCGVFSPIGVEVTAMVIAAYFSRQKRQEGQAEGRAEADAAWRAWYQRRLAAEAAGVSFDEPPPDFSHVRDGSED